MPLGPKKSDPTCAGSAAPRGLATVAAPLGAAGQPKTTSLYVTLDNTRLLSKPSAFAKKLKTLKAGIMVKAEAPKNGYVKVTVPLGEDTVSGYLSVRALQKDRPKLTAAVHKSGDASAEEVAAATKGFNKQIEADLRSQDSGDGYQKLDQALSRTAMDAPLDKLEGFREKGKLGEFKEGGE